MSRPEFDELMKSPLDEPSRSRWRPVVVGGLIGAVVTAAIFIGIGSDDPEQDSPSPRVSTLSTSTVMVLPAESSSFPLGYVEVSDTEAFKPHHVATTEDQIVVTMTTSYARGLDPTTQPWFLGGIWMLDTASGESIVSETTLFDDHVPGGFSVVFPVLPGTIVEPEQLRLVERWEPIQTTGTFDFPLEAGFDGFGHGPVSIPMNGSMLRFDNVDPNNGAALWVLEGDPQPRGVVSLSIDLLGPDEWLIATAQPPPEYMRPHGLDASQGTVRLDMIPATPGHLDTVEKEVAFWNELQLVERLLLHYTVTTPEPQPINEVVFNLPTSN